MEPARRVDPLGRRRRVAVVVRHPRHPAVEELPDLVRPALPATERVADAGLHSGERHAARPRAGLGRVVHRADAAETGGLRPAQAGDLHGRRQPRLHGRHPRGRPDVDHGAQFRDGRGVEVGVAQHRQPDGVERGERDGGPLLDELAPGDVGRERPDVDEGARRGQRAHEHVDPAAVVQRKRRPESVVGSQVQPLDEVLPQRGVGGVGVHAAAGPGRGPGGVEQDHRVLGGHDAGRRVPRVGRQLGRGDRARSGQRRELRSGDDDRRVRVPAQPRDLGGRAPRVERCRQRPDRRRGDDRDDGVEAAGQDEQHPVAAAHPGAVQPGGARPGRLAHRRPRRASLGEHDLPGR